MKITELNDLKSYAKKVLLKISPTVRKNQDIMEDGMISAVAGATIAFISIFVGDTEVANIGPLDMSSATVMKRDITNDIERSYETVHPNGFTDGSGTIYRFSDWNINIETCHSSECNDIIKPRMDAIKARNGNR